MRIVYILLTIIMSFTAIFSDGVNDSGSLEFIHAIMTIICSIAIFSFKDRPYSLYKVFHIFYLFFFCIAPAMQYKSGIKLLGTYFTEQDYIKTSIYCIVVLLLFNLVYSTVNSRLGCRFPISQYYKQKTIRTNQVNITKVLLMLSISFCVCSYFLWLNNFNFASILVRGGELATRRDVNQMAGLIVNSFLRPVPMILFLSAFIMGIRNKLILAILFLLFVITSPPTGMARLSVAALYIPVVLGCFSLMRKGNSFVLVLVFGLLVIFPLLASFRYYSSDVELQLFNFDQFLDLNFDAYSMFMRVLSNDIVTYGHQLLGVAFFWVPRSFWPDKPIGSGSYVADVTGLSFDNISMPFFGEGYINFGVIGVVVFTLLLAWFLAKQDYIYWHKTVKNEQSLDGIRYFLLMGLLMFVLRGDLLSGCAYTCGFVVSFYAVRMIISPK